MLLKWSVLSIVALISASSTIGENSCDSSTSCKNGSFSPPIKRSTALRCIKRTSCDPSDKNLVAVNHMNKIDIHLKDVRIQQKKDGYQVQVKLGLYDDIIKEGNQSLIVKFSFGKDSGCYEFLIPSSVLMNFEDIMLFCSGVSILQRDHLGFLFSVHKETGELISIQAMNYSLSNFADGQWLEGSLFRITHDFDDEFIHLFLNATQDLKCSFSYSISLYKSQQDRPCSTHQTPVYRWSDALDSPYHRMNMSKNLLSLTQKYCILAVFNKLQQCGELQSEYFYYISFFQLMPPFCKKWNFTIDVKSIIPPEREEARGTKFLGSTLRKDMIVTMALWKEYPSCFSSYCMYLYEFDSPSCDTDYGNLIPWKFKFEARSDKIVIFNSPVCGGGHGHQLLLGKFNFETRRNKTEVVFRNISIGNYCIVVVPFLIDGSARYEWARDSGPIIVTETGMNNIKELDENTEFGTKMFAAISFLLFFTAFALWSYSKYIRRSSKTNTYKEFSDENEEKEEMPFLTLPVHKVYLFHSYEDNSIRNDVSRLKHFLKVGAPFSVITLNDVLPHFFENRSETVSNILECDCSGNRQTCASNKRFIIVISEKVLMHRTSKDGDQSVLRYLEDQAFHMAFDSIVANWEEAYCHLFLVAFNESIFEDPRFGKVVPKKLLGACYTIPNDLTRLCAKLGLSPSRHMGREEPAAQGC